MNFLQRVIVIPEKLTALAAAGILYLIVQGLIWLSAVTGIDFTSVPGGDLAAVFFAALLTMGAKSLLERLPETWHTYVNSFLAWLATLVTAGFLFQALK